MGVGPSVLDRFTLTRSACDFRLSFLIRSAVELPQKKRNHVAGTDVHVEAKSLVMTRGYSVECTANRAFISQASERSSQERTGLQVMSDRGSRPFVGS